MPDPRDPTSVATPGPGAGTVSTPASTARSADGVVSTPSPGHRSMAGVVSTPARRGWRDPDVTVIGAGMAGCEAAWQLAERGLRVALIEQKPAAMSPAHQTPALGELVCSNSLRSDDVLTPAGLLKHELRRCGSLVIACADAHRVPAGAALAVERFGFGREITIRLGVHSGVRIERRVLEDLPEGPVIVATGPLTGGRLGDVIRRQLGGDRLYFYDAIAPIVSADSIDLSRAFRASRWGRSPSRDGVRVDDENTDYINCPLSRTEYDAFVAAVRTGRRIEPHDFEEPKYFESCLPIEVMADRGPDVLRFGPMRPIGLVDPRTGHRPWAVLQLRPENRYLTSYNLVGFQTRLAYPEQQRIFSMVAALAGAEFLRFGSIHRNTYIDAPRMLGDRFALRTRPSLRFAGLLTGVEGYIESCAMGLLCAWFVATELGGGHLAGPPPTTMLGGLLEHTTRARDPGVAYAPTNVNFGLLPPIDDFERDPAARGRRKEEKRQRVVARAHADLEAWLATIDQPPTRVGWPATGRLVSPAE